MFQLSTLTIPGAPFFPSPTCPASRAQGRIARLPSRGSFSDPAVYLGVFYTWRLRLQGFSRACQTIVSTGRGMCLRPVVSVNSCINSQWIHLFEGCLKPGCANLLKYQYRSSARKGFGFATARRRMQMGGMYSVLPAMSTASCGKGSGEFDSGLTSRLSTRP